MSDHPVLSALDLAIARLRTETEKLNLSRRAVDMLGEQAPANARRDVRRLERTQDAIGRLQEIKAGLEQNGVTP